MAWQTLGRHNQKIAKVRAIGQRKHLDASLVEGIKTIRDLILRGLQPSALFCTSEVAKEVDTDPVFASLPQTIGRYLLPEGVLRGLANTRHSQGMLAVFPVPKETQLKGDILLFLDRIQDPANVGAIVRVAAAMGVSGIACSPGTADPFSPKAVRASAGWALLVPVMRNVTWQGFVGEIAPCHNIVAAVPTGGTSVFDWLPSLPLALVLGNEGQGLLVDIEAQIRERITVPLAGGVESLNVAVACGILLAHVRGTCQKPYTEVRGRRQ
ncbi:MAG: TrmH family RNA methyltransferase [Thermoanaerobaculaceae bacterium]